MPLFNDPKHLVDDKRDKAMMSCFAKVLLSAIAEDELDIEEVKATLQLWIEEKES